MSPTKVPRGRAGFTLVEMLLAAALLLTAAVTAAGFMSQGIKIFLKLSASAQEESAAVCMLKLTRDLRNACDYSLIPFVRDETRVSFAALEDISVDGAEPDPMPYTVRYRWDPDQLRVVRETERGQTFDRPGSAGSEVMMTGVRAFSLKYYGAPEGLPAKVTVRMEYLGPFGMRSTARDVLLPAAPFVRDPQ